MKATGFLFERLILYYDLDEINAAEDAEGGGTPKPVLRTS